MSTPEIGRNRDSEPEPTDGVLSRRYRALTIGIITLVLMVAFEAMAVNTAMPVATRELDGRELYAWAFSAFLAASMFGTVLAGDLGDRLGPAKPFLFGLGLFVVGLVLAGTAGTMLVFIVARAIQGLGGGALVVSLLVIAGRAYPQRLLPPLMAGFSSAWVLPSLIGPVISGTLAEHVSWRWVFLGLLPLAIPPVLLMLPRLRGLPDAEPAPRRPGRKRLALAVAVGVPLLQYAGERLTPGQDPSVLGLLSLPVGLILLAISLPRLLPAGTLRFARGIPSVAAMRGLLAGAFMGMNAFVPLMLNQNHGLSVTLAGAALTVGSLGWSLGSFWQGRSTVRIPRHRLVPIGASFVTTGVLINLIVVFPAVPFWLIGFGAAIGGVGMGLAMSSLNVLILTQSSDSEKGANSAAAQLSDSLGQVVLVGFAGVLHTGLATALGGGLHFVPVFATMALVAGTGALLGGRVAGRSLEEPAGAIVRH